ncbi:hypothetical protein AC623_09095 [Bacillus sp. FJAT-27231]|uniref:helix-turn-helix transcriptional regulator n=1 Tax=Bacillus sp. FJAT-27231 TaxID=1679168 RepID=UPI0006715FD9|nr:helix-turn-helix transcriptional regulator [Bacillus sp. FJAT-27231]KMY54093.1 hypothetical protein AC623_09095 [Bacillus sp. FJAT-27231]
MLANNIAIIRKRKNITQDELAAHIGIGRTAMSRIENGNYFPSAATMYKISNFLNEPIGNIFYNPNIKEPNKITNN